ncbi:hypothetical protein JVT61DRAFT_7603 [Boletus reticuloceps]|uniref:Uncharacterized protein n=1 Tax=Boletus reticuloceps TaxID=495285 RepID=A0A8I2YIU5_9AGAM|nr:hypothetical protein JVT61DRAFT_7603 [Boletus reticuloceps]
MECGDYDSTNTFPFGVLEIRRRHDLSRISDEARIPRPPSTDADDGELSDEEDIDDDSLSLPELPSPVEIVSMNRDDKETRARRLVARLGQPFGALFNVYAGIGSMYDRLQEGSG